MSNCYCRFNCTLFAVIVSVIIGIVAALLNITAAITVTPAFLWVLFGIAVVYLAVTLLASSFARGLGLRDCVCRILNFLFAGILGTILSAVILLGITFAATSVLGAIISGLLLAFFTLTITTVACLAYCLSNCTDACDF